VLTPAPRLPVGPRYEHLQSWSDLHAAVFLPDHDLCCHGSGAHPSREDHAKRDGSGVQSFEIFTPGGAGAWSGHPRLFPSIISYALDVSLLPGGKPVYR